MLAPITGKLLITQGFGSLKGGPSEAYTTYHNGVASRCLAHPAVDINAPLGTPIVAVKAGEVTGGIDPALGNYAVLTATSTGEQFLYAHLSHLTVATGARVAVGEHIGSTGSTGNSTGPHLHFGYRPAHPNYNNGFDGYECWLTHLDPDAWLNLDFSLV